MRHNFLVEDITAGPAQRRGQRQHKAHQRDMLAAEAGFDQHQYAENRQRDPRQLFPLQTFAENKRPENDGEKGLRLQHQRCQSGRHAEANRAEQKRKLTEANRQAVAQQQAQRNFWPRDEEQRRESHQQKAQSGEHQRRHIMQPHLDHHEIQPPYHHHQQCQQPVFTRHTRLGCYWNFCEQNQTTE